MWSWQFWSSIFDIRTIYLDFLSPIVISLILIFYQCNYLFADVCVFHSFPSSLLCMQSGSLLCVLSPVIRLLPFLRLSLTRQKATCGMTGPTGLTLTALSNFIFLWGEKCQQLVKSKTIWIPSMGNFVWVCVTVVVVFLFYTAFKVWPGRLGGAEMLLGQMLVSLVYCQIIITVLWLCFGNRQPMKMFGTTCYADA